MKIHVGFKASKKPEIFESEKKPVKEMHSQYDFIHSSFESIEKAQQYMCVLGGLACGDGNTPFY